MDENDLDYEPPEEWFTTNRTLADHASYLAYPNRTVWATHMNQGNIAIPPPTWWLEEQDRKGRAQAKFAIWNKRYTYGRKLSIWLMAPLDDFRKAKFLRPRSSFRS